jgi:hypothetical protein
MCFDVLLYLHESHFLGGKATDSTLVPVRTTLSVHVLTHVLPVIHGAMQMQMQMLMRLSHAVQLGVARRPTLTGGGSSTYCSIR